LRTTVIAVGKKKYHGLYNHIYIGLKRKKKSAEICTWSADSDWNRASILTLVSATCKSWHPWPNKLCAEICWEHLCTQCNCDHGSIVQISDCIIKWWVPGTWNTWHLQLWCKKVKSQEDILYSCFHDVRLVLTTCCCSSCCQLQSAFVDHWTVSTCLKPLSHQMVQCVLWFALLFAAVVTNVFTWCPFLETVSIMCYPAIQVSAPIETMHNRLRSENMR